MWRRAVQTVVALVFLSMSIATLFQAQSDPGPSPPVGTPAGEIRISGDQRALRSAFPYVVRTTILLQYDNPINIDRSANIHITLQQTGLSGAKLRFRADSTDQKASTDRSTNTDRAIDIDQTTSVERLRWPVTLTLRSPAFDFADSDQTRQIERGRELPARVSWSLVPKRAGTWGLHLQVASVYDSSVREAGFLPPNQIEMEVNGEKKAISPTDDVVFSIEVEKLWGISSQAYEWLSIAFAFVGIVVGTDVFTGWSTRLLQRMTGKPKVERKAPRRSAKSARPSRNEQQPAGGSDSA
ncbi:hypothetical protein KXS07_16650 [Inquilinus limosus]|uniref:hypothetical protein n=1 Tax=Inquilinus limosus TaxID=171674 RepID=UPI003F18B268